MAIWAVSLKDVFVMYQMQYAESYFNPSGVLRPDDILLASAFKVNSLAKTPI